MAAKTLDPIDILLELGIDLDDLSEQDYLGALMEAIATIEFKTKGKGDERSDALREEVIKIRKGKRKPQVKTTKISAGSLKSAPRLTGKTTKIQAQKLLPGTAEPQLENETGPEQDSIIKILTDISESVKSILFSLNASNNLSKSLADDERKRQERKKRIGAENKLEKKRFEGLKNLGSKLIQPVKGPLEKLFNFIKTILLGKVLMGILDWLGDSENQKKLSSLIRFFKDWWPTIVTAVLLFGTGLGGLLKSIVGIALKFVPKLLGLLPGLLKFLKSPMGRIAGLAVAGAGLVGRMMDGGEDDVDLTKQDPAQQMMNGGIVPGRGPNKDTVPAMLAPGEFVMSRGAVQKYGADIMASMNAAGGGTNRPVMKNGITYASGGGEVGDKKHPLLEKLSDANIKKASAPLGMCVTGSLDTMLRSGVPEPAATGQDVGNNPRGAISQLMQSPYNWKSMGGSPTTLNSPYGTVRAGVYSKNQYSNLVDAGKIPSGALVFQSRYNNWNGTAPKSSGYDMAIAQRGGKEHWNGQPMPKFVYGGATKKVIVLTPDGKQGDGTDTQILPGETPSSPNAAGTPSSAGYSRPSSTSSGSPSTSSSSGFTPSPPPMVLAMKNGVQGLLNKLTGMFTPKAFTDAEKKRYKKFGGEIKESSGADVAGATADRQLGLLTPGEYVIPQDSVNNLGGPSFFDRLVAGTDSNSNPAKFGSFMDKNPFIGPPMSMQPFINVIPIPISGSKGSSDSSGSDLPNFSAGFGDPNKSKLLGVVR